LENGFFQILVNSKECWEQTLVNGKRLGKSESNENEYTEILSHLDRIFIGVNTLFLFKYPL